MRALPRVPPRARLTPFCASALRSAPFRRCCGSRACGRLVSLRHCAADYAPLALQPLSDDAAGFFNPGTSFNVTIFADANAPDAHCPGLSQGGTQIATGTLTLGQAVFYDSDRLNTEDFAAGKKVSAYTSTTLSAAEKAEWQTLVQGALGIKSSA